MHRVDEVSLEELPDRRDAAAKPYVFAVSGFFRLPQRLGRGRLEEVERGVGKGEAGSLMVGEDEHRSVEGRVVSPPPCPIEVLPWATLRAELVAPHDLGTDVAREVADEVIVQPSGSTWFGSVRPTRGGERPG